MLRLHTLLPTTAQHEGVGSSYPHSQRWWELAFIETSPTQRGGDMKPKDYMVLAMCVEQGINMGWARAHKHDPNPDEKRIKDCINEAVIAEICEWFDFYDGENK